MALETTIFTSFSEDNLTQEADVTGIFIIRQYQSLV